MLTRYLDIVSVLRDNSHYSLNIWQTSSFCNSSEIYVCLKGFATVVVCLQVYHGDIKSENVMITSWNWVLLTDFASFKPTYIPEVTNTY